MTPAEIDDFLATDSGRQVAAYVGEVFAMSALEIADIHCEDAADAAALRLFAFSITESTWMWLSHAEETKQ